MHTIQLPLVRRKNDEVDISARNDECRMEGKNVCTCRSLRFNTKGKKLILETLLYIFFENKIL